MKEKPPDLKREHSALENNTSLVFFLFYGSILTPWIRIRLPNADPDPQHLFFLQKSLAVVKSREPKFSDSYGIQRSNGEKGKAQYEIHVDKLGVV